MQLLDVGGLSGSGQKDVPQQVARDRITLDPLHPLRSGALDAQGIPEIIKITLTQLSSRWDNAFSDVTTHEAEDIFESAAAEGAPYDPVPEAAALVHAIFSIHFADSPEPRYVTIVPPYILDLERPEDRPAVLLWLAKHGFLIPGGSSIPLLQHSSTPALHSPTIPSLHSPSTPLLHSASFPKLHSPVWKTLESVRGLAALGTVWSARLGPDYPGFKFLCLEPRAMFVRHFPYPCSCGCPHRIRHNADGSAIAACHSNPPCCADLPLTRDDITAQQVNRQKLGRAICKAFQFDVRFVDLRIPNTVQIGCYSADAVPVILTIQTDRQVFRRAIAELVARFNCPFILLAPTNHHMDLPSHELLTRVHAGFFPLDRTVRLSDYGTLLPLRPPGELFAGFRPDPSGSVSEENARQLIALVRALAAKYPFRKAPLYIVFLLYCADGRTVKQIARDCHCDPSLIFSRLKLLHRKLGRHPAELRQYSDHLEKVAASFSDPRARRIHRKRAINGDDQEDDA